MSLNINQFQQVPVQGDLDLQIAESKTISGQLSDSQATSLLAGTAVKLDSANTGKLPSFVKAESSDVAIGYIKRTVQAATFATGDKVEVCGHYGPVMWVLAGATVTPGERVEQSSDESGVIPVSSGKVVGVAIDYATTGQLTRVILMTPAASNS